MTFGVRGVGGQEILLITMGCNQATPAGVSVKNTLRSLLAGCLSYTLQTIEKPNSESVPLQVLQFQKFD